MLRQHLVTEWVVVTLRHNLKAGYEAIRTRGNSRAASLPSGVYRFGGTEPVGSYAVTGALTVAGTGNVIGAIAERPFTFGP